MHATTLALAAFDPNWITGGLFAVLFAAIAAYAVPVPQGDRRWWALLILLGLVVTASFVVPEGVARTLLIDAAALVAVGLVWVDGAPKARRAAGLSFILLVVAVVAIGAGLALVGEGAAAPAAPFDRVAVTLLVVGFGLKLALAPFYFWLPAVAESAAPMTTAVIVSIVDIAAFSELAHVRTVAPWVFTEQPTLWLALALLSMFGGALLALAQRDLRRLLAFSTIDDLGYLLIGVLAGSEAGLVGAWLGALSHALFKVMLFAALGVAERYLGRPVTLADRGLAASLPVSAAAFIVGALGMIGVPPLFGFAGRWRLYLAGAELGGVPLILAMAVATGVALLYYVRVVHVVWLGSAPEARPSAEPRLAAGVLIVLMLVAVGFGLYPAALTGLLR